MASTLARIAGGRPQTGKGAHRIGAEIDAGGLDASYADLTAAEIQAIADFMSS